MRVSASHACLAGRDDVYFIKLLSLIHLYPNFFPVTASRGIDTTFSSSFLCSLGITCRYTLSYDILHEISDCTSQ